MSLFFVEKPENMLNEAFRVLKPGGRAVFSVLGLPGECNLNILYAKCIKNSQIELPKERSYFH